MISPAIGAKIAAILGAPPRDLQPLSGGCVGEVYGLRAGDGCYVVKVDRAASGALAVEGRMLDYLARHTRLPTPRPLGHDNAFLLMTRLPGSASLGGAAEHHAAALLGELHNVSHAAYGFEFDTVIGGLPQPNAYTASWLEFFADRRLLAMARQAFDAGRLPAALVQSLETLAGRLSRWLDEPARPGLIHGDVWGGNVLAADGKITGLIDPAVYFADPEIELAFITLFHTFGDAFFQTYRERREITSAFWEAKKDIYNLYPLLVHARLFGGGYVDRVAATLRRFAG